MLANAPSSVKNAMASDIWKVWPEGGCSLDKGKLGKLGAYAMKRVAVKAEDLSSPRLLSLPNAKMIEPTTALGCSFLHQCEH